MLKPKNDEKKKKVLEKPKGKRQPRTRLTVAITTIIVLIFIAIIFSLRSPILELPVVTPTIAVQLAAVTPRADADNTPETTVVNAEGSPEGVPAISNIAGTISPTPVQIDATVVVATDLRSGPGLNFPVVEHLNNGVSLTLIGANADFSWYLVGSRQQPAWIDASTLNQSAGAPRGLPIIGAVSPVPTNTFSPELASMTATPVMAYGATDISTYAGPGFNFARGTTIRGQTPFMLVGVSEDGQWYLARNFSVVSNRNFPQGWIPASAVPTSVTGDFRFLQVIKLADGPRYVTLIATPTFTPTPTPSINRTSGPTPTFTATTTPTPTDTLTPTLLAQGT